MRKTSIIHGSLGALALGLLTLWPDHIQAQGPEGDEDQDQQEAPEAAQPGEQNILEEAVPAQAAPARRQEDEQRLKLRDRQAEESFNSLMGKQNAPEMSKVPMHDYSALGGAAGAGAEAGALAEVPLKEFTTLRDRLNKLREARARTRAPAVVLGAAEYRGEAGEGALALKVAMQVTLGQADRFKVVPLIGDDVVVTRATVGSEAVPLSRQTGYHVWVTKRTGELTVNLDVLVPARGPRGSIEYDFLVARTPETHFACRFPVAGLEPRLTGAVRAQVRTVGTWTELDATLSPTTHVHLVGFREVGDSNGRQKKVYADTLNLLSIDEDSIDLFSVVRYTILYAGTKEFHLLVPSDMTVVSADGEGAFRYETEHVQGGTLIRGETSYPIRNAYEISLRLHRSLPKEGGQFDAPLTHCVGVEREQGYLAVEVPGKLQLTEAGQKEALAIDARQLPDEMVQSAVSPILKAYRYHSDRAKVTLAATRLPERDPVSASIDRVRAFSVVDMGGQVLTDMRITLRNRLLPSLTLALPADTEIRSALLDGEPVKPSRNDKGEVVLPLKRSAGSSQLAPFTLQVVLQTAGHPLHLLSRAHLELPALQLPASSVAWTFFLPAKNSYGRIEGDIDPQTLVGQARWHQPREAPPARNARLATGTATTEGGSADTGAMPVRINLPQTGIRREHNRYWLAAGEPIAVHFWYMRSWLRLPLGLALIALAALGLSLWARNLRLRARARRPAVLGLVLVAILSWPLVHLTGLSGLILAVLVAGAYRAHVLGVLAKTFGDVHAWLVAAMAHLHLWPKTEQPRSFSRVLGRLCLAGSVAFATVIALVLAIQVLRLLFRPLAG